MCSTHTTRLFFEIFSNLPHFRSILASINSPFLNQFPHSSTLPFSPLPPLNLSFSPTFQYFIEQFPNRPLQTTFISPTFSNLLYVSIKYTFLPNSFLLYNVNFSLPHFKNLSYHHRQLLLLLSSIPFSTSSKLTLSNICPHLPPHHPLLIFCPTPLFLLPNQSLSPIKITSYENNSLFDI